MSSGPISPMLPLHSGLLRKLSSKVPCSSQERLCGPNDVPVVPANGIKIGIKSCSRLGGATGGGVKTKTAPTCLPCWGVPCSCCCTPMEYRSAPLTCAAVAGVLPRFP
jgi:hypothetical protein